MAYKNKYGITQIRRQKLHNLSINWDANVVNVDKCSKKSRYPVLLYTPSMFNTTDHYHIPLTRTQAKVLRDWLTNYLRDTK